jgi:hypothetical protein
MIDILSRQPTYVKPLDELSESELRSSDQLVFNTRCFFAVGSPAAFLFHIRGAQLIARKGRERTKDAPADVALDRAGRYGCMAGRLFFLLCVQNYLG